MATCTPAPNAEGAAASSAASSTAVSDETLERETVSADPESLTAPLTTSVEGAGVDEEETSPDGEADGAATPQTVSAEAEQAVEMTCAGAVQDEQGSQGATPLADHVLPSTQACKIAAAVAVGDAVADDEPEEVALAVAELVTPEAVAVEVAVGVAEADEDDDDEDVALLEDATVALEAAEAVSEALPDVDGEIVREGLGEAEADRDPEVDTVAGEVALVVALGIADGVGAGEQYASLGLSPFAQPQLPSATLFTSAVVEPT